jgi:hypothetical protein
LSIAVISASTFGLERLHSPVSDLLLFVDDGLGEISGCSVGLEQGQRVHV